LFFPRVFPPISSLITTFVSFFFFLSPYGTTFYPVFPSPLRFRFFRVKGILLLGIFFSVLFFCQPAVSTQNYDSLPWLRFLLSVLFKFFNHTTLVFFSLGWHYGPGFDLPWPLQFVWEMLCLGWLAFLGGGRSFRICWQAVFFLVFSCHSFLADALPSFFIFFLGVFFLFFVFFFFVPPSCGFSDSLSP